MHTICLCYWCDLKKNLYFYVFISSIWTLFFFTGKNILNFYSTWVEQKLLDTEIIDLNCKQDQRVVKLYLTHQNLWTSKLFVLRQ